MTDRQILNQLKTKTISEVSALSGRPHSSIYRLFKKANPGQRLDKSRLSKEHVLAHSGKGIERIKEMRRLQKKGLTLEQIGNLQNPPITKQRVSQLLKMLYFKA